MINWKDDTDWQHLQTAFRHLTQQEVYQRFRHVQAEQKQDGSLVTEADQAMQQAMRQFLKDMAPEYAFLGEESDPKAQLKALHHTTGCWILDPLDGTTNFAHGCPIYAASLALSVKGEVVAGMVYDPVRDELFSARKGAGAWLNDTRIQTSQHHGSLKHTLALVDFKRLPTHMAASLATQPPFSSQRNIGAVVLDWCWLAAGRAELYLHGGQGLWDYAAGQLILQEAGGASCTLEGTPVANGTLEKRSAVAAANPTLLAQWLEYLRNMPA